MVHRASYKMPSCTNQLESTHGHLNSQLPRNNSFWPGMQRIADNIMKKIHNYELFYKQNYSRYKRKIRNICYNTPSNIMQNMIRSYKTDITSETCLCGESVLISSMLQINLPCSHLYFLGMQFPKFEVPKLEIEYITNDEVFVEYKIIESQKIETNCDYYDKIRLYTVKIIKRYSHYKKKEDIEKYVAQRLPFTQEPTKFVLNYPIEIFPVIENGINHFTKMKSQKT